MPEILLTHSLPHTKLAQLLKQCPFSPKDFFLAEQLPTRLITTARERQSLLYFERYSPELFKKVEVENYTSGRVFHEDFELRWERAEQKIRVRYLGLEERGDIIATLRDFGLKEDHKILKGLKIELQQEKSYYLFGKRLKNEDIEIIGKNARPGDFADIRISRILRYPDPHEAWEQIRLVTKEYRDEQGNVVLYRFQRLEQGGVEK